MESGSNDIPSSIEPDSIFDCNHITHKAVINHRLRERKTRQRIRRQRLKTGLRLREISARSRLCLQCRGIDFDAILNTRLDLTFRRQGILVASLEASPVQLIESQCPLCRLFGCMVPFKDSDGDLIMKICHLLVLSARRTLLGQEPHASEWDVSLLGVGNFFDSEDEAQSSLDQTGYLGFKASPPLDMQIINPGLFDAGFAQRCIAYCEINHHQTCQRGGESLPFLRVIDCTSRQVVRAPASCQYVALSYVWGSSTSDTILDDELPQSDCIYLPPCPDVIENSLAVTIMIGYRYIWIDRYCIDQQDSIDKHHQINNMDAIYTNAYITIVAAAGDGPDHGLPGVNRPRKVQPHLVLNSKHLVSTLPHASAVVNSSRWASRGWTYQEGILSKRRLIFTDEQVYFECSNMYCAESLRLSTSEDQILHMQSRTNIFSGLLARQSRSHYELTAVPSQIMSCISDFSKRELSFASDTLNALQGIFRVFAKTKPPLYNLCGVPILDSGSYTRFDGKKRIDNQSLLPGLTWFHPKPGFRNDKFPSWSWAGWKGEISQHLVFNQVIPRAGSQIKLATISVPKSQITTNANFRQSLGDLSTNRINQYIRLNITAWMASCSTVHILPSHTFPGLAFSDSTGDMIFEVHSASESFGLHLRIKFDLKLDASSTVYALDQPLLCVFLASALIPCNSDTVILIVEEQEDSFERVGIAEFLGLFRWVTVGADAGWERESGFGFGMERTSLMQFASWRRIKLG